MIGKKDMKIDTNNRYPLYCFGIAVVLITVFSCSSFLYEINPWSDANIFLTMGRGMLSGKVMYTDLFDHKGPFLYFIYVLAALISSNSFFGVYLIEIVCLTGFLFYTHKILELFGRKNPWIELLVAGVAITTCKAFSFGGGSAEELFLPVTQGINYLVLKRVVNNQNFERKDAFMIGVTACLTFLTKFTMSGFYLGLAIFLIVYQWKKERRTCIRCVLWALAGFAGSFAVISLYFIFCHNFTDFIHSYFLFNLNGYSNSEASILIGIYKMIRAFFFYWKNNVGMLSLSVAGMVSLLVYAFRKKKMNLFFYYLLTTGFWYFFSFIGQRFIAYYILSIGMLVPFYSLMIKNAKMMYAGSLILMVAMICTSGNLRWITRRNTVQKQFTDYIQASDTDQSLLVYKGYDEGFYLMNHSIPDCRYYTTINADIAGLDEEVLNCIEEKKISFLISMDEELNLPEYRLVLNAEQEYDGKVRNYYLYERELYSD